jgi:LPXTG-motif cell wall-anchored protein
VGWSYGVVNLPIFAVGLGLVALGSWLSARRKRAVLPAVNPAK